MTQMPIGNAEVYSLLASLFSLTRIFQVRPLYNFRRDPFNLIYSQILQWFPLLGAIDRHYTIENVMVG